MEVTVGKVDFLSLFSTIGQNRGIKLNTFFVNDETIDIQRCNPSIDLKEPQIDFVFSFHELEHVNQPIRFLNLLAEKIHNNPQTVFFFTVPNGSEAFGEGKYLDIIYEHVSYFTIPSLHYLFNSCGFDVLAIEAKNDFSNLLEISAAIGKQYSLSDYKPSLSDLNTIKSSILSFAFKSNQQIEKNKGLITNFLNSGERIVVWGAGSRGVTFLNLLKDNRIEYAVDINPNKQGMYIPGTGQQIINPEFLISYKPHRIILPNIVYKTEIKEVLEKIGIQPEFILL